MRLPAKARRRVGELRWSVRIARNNYKQFGGVLQPNALLDMLGDQNFGERRPAVITRVPPAKIKEAERAAAVEQWDTISFITSIKCLKCPEEYWVVQKVRAVWLLSPCWFDFWHWPKKNYERVYTARGHLMPLQQYVWCNGLARPARHNGTDNTTWWKPNNLRCYSAQA